MAHLRRMFKRVGSGSMLRVTTALGLRRTYFSEWKTRPPAVLDAGLVLAALKVLGIPAALFFRDLDPPAAAGAAELWEGPEPVEERATPATRRAVAIAYQRMRAELGLDVDAGEVEGGEPSAGGPVEVSTDPAASLGAEWLEDLDARRQVEPEAVIAELAAHLHQVEAAHLPRALGIWGSALWVQIDLEAAAYVNRRALRLARTAGDDAAVADLLLRRGNVVADAGDHTRALALADLAAGISGRSGDQAGRGIAAGDQAKWLYYCNRPKESTAAAERALELLPESLPVHRAAAYSGLSLCYLEFGDLTRAQELSEAAERLPVGPWERGKLARIRARICRKLGNRSEAVEHLWRAVEILQDLHHGETVAISLELVQELLENGDAREARRVCGTMHRLAAPLHRNPIISAAVTELLRITVSGRSEEFSVDLVRRVRAVVERERSRKETKARRAWRALVCKS